jgi:ribosome-associated protein
VARLRDLVLEDGRRVDGSLLDVKTSRSGGPGGQHVNKTETRVEVRVALHTLPLSDEELARVRTVLASRIDKADRVAVVRDSSRSQSTNLDEALSELERVLSVALRRPKKRRPTRPTKGSKERRLGEKKARADVKRGRGRIGDD